VGDIETLCVRLVMWDVRSSGVRRAFRWRWGQGASTRNSSYNVTRWFIGNYCSLKKNKVISLPEKNVTSEF